MPFGSGSFALLTRSVSVAGFLLCLVATTLVGAQAQAAERMRILDNRFRIDPSVERCILIVQRREGSAPVVVVQPDGSKWYAQRHPKNRVKWGVSSASDIIQIDSPTPGPWQLVGDVVDGSEMLMISALRLEHDPLPEQVYRGQRVKLTAQIMGDEERIQIQNFHKQLDWKVEITSTNTPGDENYGVGSFVIGVYQDEGRHLDERSDDGFYTSELDFNYPTGNYFLRLSVVNPVFEREYTGKIEILPQPVTLNLIEPSQEGGKDYKLELNLATDVLPEQIHMNLTMVTPKVKKDTFSINPTEYRQTLDLDMVDSYGHYSVSGDIAGTAIGGKEFFLDLPPLSFYVAPPPPPPPSERELKQAAYEKAVIEEATAKRKVVWVVGLVNGILLIIGTVGLIFWRKRQRLYQTLMDMPDPEPELTPDEVDLTLDADEPAKGH